MKRFIKGTAILGKVALLLLLGALAADILMDGAFFDMIKLDTLLVSQGQEMWRLVTYPFAMESVMSSILFAAVFLVFLPQLDKSLPKQLIVPISLILLIFQSLVYTLVFWDRGLVYGGMDGLSIYFLTLLILSMPNERLFIFGRRFGKVLHICSLLFVSWVATNLISLEFAINREQELLNLVSSVVFGVSTAGLTYSIIRGFHYYIERKEASLRAVPTISPEKLQEVYAENYTNPTGIGAVMKSREKEPVPMPLSLIEQISPKGKFTEGDEDIMNTILDKISLHGEESLNEDERQSLLLLSKKIDLLSH
jgi:membrane associated rhomboid family serine protease